MDARVYTSVGVRTDILVLLKRLAKHRGLTFQELLTSFIEDTVDDCELMEIGYSEFIDKDK